MNKIFVATSLDGYIADIDGGLSWLPMPDEDGSYEEFLKTIDAIVMGKNTYEAMLKLAGDYWPYNKPVFVVTSNLSKYKDKYSDNVSFLNGKPSEIVSKLHGFGYKELYVDGGKTIQGFIKEDLIDEITITTIPKILGGGIPLFGQASKLLEFDCLYTKIVSGCLIESKYKRAI